MLRKIFRLTRDEVRGGGEEYTKGPSGSVKRNKYSSSDEIEQRLAQKRACVSLIRGLYTLSLRVSGQTKGEHLK